MLHNCLVCTSTGIIKQKNMIISGASEIPDPQSQDSGSFARVLNFRYWKGEEFKVCLKYHETFSDWSQDLHID